jgi:hypothetical protein
VTTAPELKPEPAIERLVPPKVDPVTGATDEMLRVPEAEVGDPPQEPTAAAATIRHAAATREIMETH